MSHKNGDLPVNLKSNYLIVSLVGTHTKIPSISIFSQYAASFWRRTPENQRSSPFCQLVTAMLIRLLKVPFSQEIDKFIVPKEMLLLLLCFIEFWYSVIVYHYSDVTMGAIASQITSHTIVYSTVYSDADQRKHQSWPVNSPHKGPVTRKMFPFDDVIMCACVLCALIGAFGLKAIQ